jgi:hypothetical protein
MRAPQRRPLQRRVELRLGQDDLLDARGVHDERRADELADGDARRLARVFRIASSRMHVRRKEGHVDGRVDASEFDDLLHERYGALAAELEPEQTPALVGRDPQHLSMRVVLRVAEGACHERGRFAGSVEPDGGRDGAGHGWKKLERGIVATADDDAYVDELEGRGRLVVADDLCPHGLLVLDAPKCKRRIRGDRAQGRLRRGECKVCQGRRHGELDCGVTQLLLGDRCSGVERSGFIEIDQEDPLFCCDRESVRLFRVPLDAPYWNGGRRDTEEGRYSADNREQGASKERVDTYGMSLVSNNSGSSHTTRPPSQVTQATRRTHMARSRMGAAREYAPGSSRSVRCPVDRHMTRILPDGSRTALAIASM